MVSEGEEAVEAGIMESERKCGSRALRTPKRII
jgi:hypothetical protein